MCPNIKVGLCNSVGIQMILIIPAGYPPPASSPTCREGVWNGGGGHSPWFCLGLRKGIITILEV